MDITLALSLCLLSIPALALFGWLAYEFNDRFSWQLPTRPERRGFEVLNLRPRQTGYSFVEVMFAVVVLGVGFVMLAAMFPVAISQTQTTSEESVGASVARGAAQHLKGVADRHSMRPTDLASPSAPAPMLPFTGVYNQPLAPAANWPQGHAITPDAGSWEAVRGNLILQTDPRFAFVPLYSRESSSNVAKVVIVVVRSRNRPNFDATDVTPGVGANLQPRAVTVNIQNNVDNAKVDWITFSAGAVDAVAPGTCVVISNHAAGNGSVAGRFNGQVVRVGNKAEQVGATVPAANTWTLVPGNDFPADPGVDDTIDTADDRTIPIATAYVIGREFNGTDYNNIAQDVSFYTTFVEVRP